VWISVTRRQALLSGIGSLLGRALVVEMLGGIGAGLTAVPPSIAASPPTDEVENLVALAEVLVGDRPFPAEVRDDLVDDLRDAVRTDPARAKRYGATARVLDRLAGQRFALLTFSDRAALVAQHRLGTSRMSGDEAEALADDVREARAFLGPDVIAAYWRTPAGWNAVGYTIFPGRCGDLTRYTRPPA
jgi:hypothetical protein